MNCKPEKSGHLKETPHREGKVNAYLQLIRFPNIFTAVADVLAGYLIAVGLSVAWVPLLGLMAASGAIYAAGCVLNDIADRETDQVTRPFRPIPAGRISVKEAGAAAFILIVFGLVASSLAGKGAVTVYAVLVLLVILYDGWTKTHPVAGPVTMAGCRAANLVLGMSPIIAVGSVYWLFPVLTLFYVFGLTFLSRFEVAGGPGRFRWLILLPWIVTALTLLGLNRAGTLDHSSLIYLCALVLMTGPFLVRGLITVSPSHIGVAVKYLILGIPVLDAVYVAGIRGFFFGMLVILFLFPAYLFSRFFYVT